MDFITGLPNVKGYFKIWVVVDYFTKMAVRKGTWPRGYTKAGWIVVGAAGRGRGGVTRSRWRDKVGAA